MILSPIPVPRKVLVTGGTGYISFHTVVELMAAGHEVFIVGNLCNNKAPVSNLELYKIKDGD